MSFVNAEPEIMSAAAGNLASIGDSMTAGASAAAGPTTGVVAPAADLVSAFATAQFATHAELFQAISAQAAAVHEHLVANLTSNASAYATAEAANAATTG
ncbi:PE family protein [Mycobacterium sp. pUA109]|uniref:PE family protein n=1 Tax=Mycobacterium sp. pUA109 TaxID=3238982 RepID=UPI00351B9517